MIKFKLVHYTQRVNQFGENPIHLRLTKYKKVTYLGTGISWKTDQWNEKTSMINHKHPQNKKLNEQLAIFENDKTLKYKNLTPDQKKDITIEEYLELIKPKNIQFQSKNFFDILENNIKNLKQIDKHSTAKYFHDMRNSVLRFNKSNKLDIDSISIAWLESYEKHLRLRKYKDTSISVRMRAIRTIFNDSIKAKIVGLDKYPFKEYEISKLNINTKKRAIAFEEIQLIKNLDTHAHPQLKLSRDLFIFSYYTAGMNYIDMLTLKHSDISRDNRLRYTRSKTKGIFNFKLNTHALEIVEYYRENRINTEYLFPILLSDKLTAKQIDYRKQKTLTQFNKDLKEIGRICNIEFDLTSYVSRHSYASIQRDSGLATDIISKTLGHKNINQTNVYLDSMKNEVIDNAFENMK